jgi:small-conductance mechanosensitive channel
MNNNEPKGSFVRWQSTTITQLTYSVNLFLGLAIGALGFQVTILLNEKFNPVGWQKCAFSVSMFLLLLSIALGIWCIINRLRDFRATAKAARMREEEKPNEDIQPYRDLYKNLGKKTWILFRWQVGTFGIGIFFSIVGVWASMSQKLLCFHPETITG